MQLLGEEVDTEVTVLTSLRRGGNTDDLTGTTLEIQQVTNADVVAWNGDGTTGTGASSGTTRSRHGYGLTFFNDSVDRRGVVMMVLVVVTRSVDWVEDVISSAVKSVTERVILAFVVVISHVKLAVLGRVDGSTSLSFDAYFLLGRGSVVVVPDRCGAGVVLDVRTRCILNVRVLGYGIGSATVVTFDNVNLRLEVSSRTVSGTVLLVVGLVLDVDLCVDVTLVRFTVARSVSGTGLSKEGKQRCGKRESGRREEDMGG